MSKPNPNKATPRRRRKAPAARKPAVAKPVAAVIVDPPQPLETPAPPAPVAAAPGPEAMFDHEEAQQQQAPETWPVTLAAEVEDQRRRDEDQEAPAPAEVQDEAIEEVQAEAAPAAPPVTTPPPPADMSDDPKPVTMGGVDGVRYRIGLGVVQQLLGPDALDRVEVLRGHPSILALQQRMRVTDGRCAPVFMTEEDGQAPILFSGVESIACAINLGLPTISVVTIAPADAPALQWWLSARVAEQNRADAKPDDDVMLYEAYSS